MTLSAAIKAYVAHDDPLVRACNVIALVIAANQPFYPLYVLWLLVHDVAPTLLTFLSTPFFVAVPLVARRSPRLSRVMVALAGLANTMLVVRIFGQASGVEIFLIPCMLISSAFFRRSEGAIAIGLVALGFGIFLGLDGRYGVPICQCSAADERALLRLHALSAGTLVVLIGSLTRDSRSSPRSP